MVTMEFTLLNLECDNGHKLIVPMGYGRDYQCRVCRQRMYAEGEPEKHIVDVTPRIDLTPK